MSSSPSSGSSIGFVGLLQLAFIVLKLCDVIDWSWWTVMSPFLISLAVVVICLAVAGLMIAVAKRR